MKTTNNIHTYQLMGHPHRCAGYMVMSLKANQIPDCQTGKSSALEITWVTPYLVDEQKRCNQNVAYFTNTLLQAK